MKFLKEIPPEEKLDRQHRECAQSLVVAEKSTKSQRINNNEVLSGEENGSESKLLPHTEHVQVMAMRGLRWRFVDGDHETKY